MRVVYHPAVQNDVSKILHHYDAVNRKLGDEFWAELISFVGKAAEKPQRFHWETPNRRRVNLERFPYHFLFREVPGGIRILAVRHHKQHPKRGLERR